MNKLLIIIFSLLAVILCSCKKTNNLPDYYFSCKIDGKNVNLYPSRDLGYIPDRATYTKVEYDFKRVTLNAYDGNSKAFSIRLEDTGKVITTGNYLLSVIYTGSSFSTYKDYDSSSRYGYVTDSVNTGAVYIEIDKNTETVKGTFVAKLSYENSEKVIEITDGKFFIPYLMY